MVDSRDVLREKLRQKQQLDKLTPAQRFKFEQERRQAVKERNKQLKEAAEKYEQLIKSARNISEAKQILNKAPSEIKKRINITEKSLEEEQQKRIDTIQDRISARKKQIKEADDSARRKGYRTEISELEKFIPQLKQGKILDPKEIIQFADSKGDKVRAEERREDRQREQRKEAIEKAIKTGAEVSKINYDKGTATIAGQKVKLSKDQLKDIQLSSVKRARGKQKREALEQLSKQDLNVGELRKKGVSFEDIGKIGTLKLRRDIIKGAKDRKLNTDELKSLGFSEKQVEVLKGEKLPTIGELKKQGFSQREIGNIGKIQLRRTLLRKSKNLPLKQPSNIKQAFRQAGLGFVAEAFTENQLKQINKNLNAPVSTTEGVLQVGKPDKNLVENLRQKALKGDKGAQRTLLTFASTGATIGKDTVNFIKELPNIVENTKDFVKVVSSLTKQDINKIGRDLGSGLQRGDPRAIADAFWILAPLPVPEKKLKVLGNYIGKGTENIKKILPKRDTIKNLNEEIKKLEGAGVNVKQRDSLAADRLRYLKDLKNLDKDLVKLDNLIEQSNKVQKDFIKKPTTKKTDIRVQTAKENLEEITKLDKKIDKQKKKLKKQRQKLGDVKKAEKLKELFEVPKPKIQVKKELPNNTAELEKRLLEARKIGGEAFSNLKKQIKNNFGFNVVQRGSGNNIRYKLLEPKENKRKGVETKKKQKTYIITKEGRIIRADKIPKAKVDELIPENQKIKSKKEIKDLEFKEGQNLDNVLNDIRDYAKKKEGGLKYNKKAQAQFKVSYKKSYKNYRDKIKNEYKDVQRFINQYRGKKGRKVPEPPKNKQGYRFWSKDDIKKFEKNKQKNIEQLKEIQIDLTKFIKTSRVLRVLIPALRKDMNSLIKQAQKETEKLDNIIKNIQDFKIPKDSPRTPKGTLKQIKPLKSGKPVKFKKTPKTKVSRPRIPKKPRIIRPIKPKRIPKPFPDFDLDTTPPKGQRLAFDVLYRERKNISKKFNRKTNPVVVKRKKLKAPVNEALKKAIKATDNSTTRSFQLIPVGFTKKKDIKQPKSELSKFRSRKTKKALILVEKSKHAIDTKGEKRGLSMTRALKGKKKPKKKVIRKKSKKFSRNNKK